MSLENVRAFYENLANDKSLRALVQNAKNKHECSQIVRAAGYDFSQEEFEQYTAQLLELSNEEIKDLDVKEMAMVMGGRKLPDNLMVYGLPPNPNGGILA